jgi:hypothetical protein
MVRYAMVDEALQFKERKKHMHDPDNLTPAEKHAKAVKKLTGGKPNMAAYTRW